MDGRGSVSRYKLQSPPIHDANYLVPSFRIGLRSYRLSKREREREVKMADNQMIQAGGGVCVFFLTSNVVLAWNVRATTLRAKCGSGVAVGIGQEVNKMCGCPQV